MLYVHHLAVRVSDLAQAEAFYTQVLGLFVIRRWADECGKPRSVWLGLGDGAFLAVELSPTPTPRDSDGVGWHCVALAIPRAERESWRARLVGAGCKVVRESSYTLYTEDPDGNSIGLSHYPELCAAAVPS